MPFMLKAANKLFADDHKIPLKLFKERITFLRVDNWIAEDMIRDFKRMGIIKQEKNAHGATTVKLLNNAPATPVKQTAQADKRSGLDMKKFFVGSIIAAIVALVAGVIGLQIVQNTVGNAGFTGTLSTVATNIPVLFAIGLFALGASVGLMALQKS